MPYISHKYKFLFYSAPATGSTAVIDAFRQREIGEFYPEEGITDGDKRLVPRKHGTPKQLENAGLLDEGVIDYFHFVGTRNPFSFHVAKYLRNKTKRLKALNNPNSWINKMPERDKIVYSNKIRKTAKQSFRDYLMTEFKKYKISNQPTAVQQLYHQGIDQFIHQENLNNDLKKVCKHLDIDPIVQTKMVNVTNAMANDETYHDYYDDETIELVLKWNAPSFELFPEYDFEGFHEERIIKS